MTSETQSDDGAESAEGTQRVPFSAEYGCSFRTDPNGENHGSCDMHGVEFDTSEEYREHLRQEHPIACSAHNCRSLATYTLAGDRKPHSWCVEHVDDEPRMDLMRVERPANSEAPTLPDDHPIEVMLRGLEQ